MTRIVDFLFCGVAVIPATLLLLERPDLAMLVFSPLLIVACFTAGWSGDYPAGAKRKGPMTLDCERED